jgi:hypothetical protein
VEWVAKTTIKQTTENNDHQGWLGSIAGGSAQKYNQDQARTTIRETTENSRHVGIHSGIRRKIIAYDPKQRARTTIRETTEQDGHLGIGGGIRKKNIAYDPKQRARTTIRETTEQDDHLGITSGISKKHKVYDPKDRARTTIRETTEDNRHIGGAGTKSNQRHTVHPQDKARATIREITEKDDHVGNVSGAQLQSGKGYITNKYDAKNTNRQFTSDNEYTGIANAADRKTRSYDDAYNARLNVNKEVVAEGRDQMSGGPRLGHQEICMETKKLDSDRVNRYSAVKTGTIGNMFNPKSVTRSTHTSERNYLPQDDTRLDVDILEALKRNPLALSYA